MQPVMVSLFDLSGVMARPWAEAGYRCVCLDIQHEEIETHTLESGGSITYAPADLREGGRHVEGAAFVAAFPPCDHLAVSGARWFQGKGLRALSQAIELVAAAAELCEASGAPYCIENPVSTLATYWRKPDYTFDPCDFAGYLDDPAPEAYTKRTCLWTGGGFVMPAPRRVEPVLGSKMHRLPPSAERKNLRSQTPEGFARAVRFANSHVDFA